MGWGILQKLIDIELLNHNQSAFFCLKVLNENDILLQFITKNQYASTQHVKKVYIIVWKNISGNITPLRGINNDDEKFCIEG